MAYNNNRYSNPGTGYVGAPYNFVPFTTKVCEYDQEKIPAQNAVSEELYSGEISYRIKARTPILVSKGKEGDYDVFFKDNYGRYAIPGSSLRGLIRSNLQVLSLAGMSDDIDDYSLMFRSVAGKREDPNKGRYASVLGAATKTINNGEKSQSLSVLLNVRAGYVRNEGGVYKIYDTGLDQVRSEFGMMNYYVLSERKIAKDYADSRYNHRKFSYDFFMPNGRCITENDITRPFEKIVKGRFTRYKGYQNKAYKPYFLPCSYELNGREVIAVGKPGVYSYEGFAVSSGYMNEKKSIYIIPAADYNKTLRFDNQPLPIVISEADEKAFHIDLNKRSTTLKTFGGAERFDLPEKDQERPIFYINLNGRLYFGFTPRLRLFYDYTIKDGLPEAHLKSKMDYAKAMFGYSNNEDSRKSRVSFSDAAAVNPSGKEVASVPAILAEPKPTSYMDYVEPVNGSGVTYNDPDFHLRGMKQYWLRSEAADTKVPAEKLREKYVTHMKPLPQGTEFEGKVRFHNLKKEELGFLLWAMKLNGKSCMNIGKAKAFGYGVIKLEVGDAKIMDEKSAYDLTAFTLDPLKKVDSEEYISTAKDVIRSFLGGKDPEEYEPIKVLYLMKDLSIAPNEKDIRYMSIDASEYQSRVTPLKTAAETLGVAVSRQPQPAGRPRTAAPASAAALAATSRAGTSRAADNSSTTGTSRAAGISGIAGSSGSASPAAPQQPAGLTAKVRMIDNFGNVYLEQSDTIKKYAKIPKEYKGAKTYEVGDTVLVKYVSQQKTKKGVSNIYRPVN